MKVSIDSEYISANQLLLSCFIICNNGAYHTFCPKMRYNQQVSIRRDKQSGVNAAVTFDGMDATVERYRDILAAVSQKYLHISMLQAINTSSAMIPNKLIKHKLSPMKPIKRYLKGLLSGKLSLFVIPQAPKFLLSTANSQTHDKAHSIASTLDEFQLRLALPCPSQEFYRH